MAAIRESDYMFTLTESGRANLNAILEEFLRANRHYGPLYHLRLIPWSEDGEVSVSESQWEAFINSHTASPDDEDWWEWDGPHTAKPGFSYLSLGMWTGDPDGLQEFTDLANALVNVLSRENFSATDAPEHDFRSVSCWLSTVHYWAFKYQLPLLRSDMTLWGAEDSQSDQFFELAEMQVECNGISYPLHPLCFSLVDNVFTSSAAAIRAILQPATVISTNEPWCISTARPSTLELSHKQHGGTLKQEEVPYHRLANTPFGWLIYPAGSVRHLPLSRCQAGLHRIAAMIGQSPTPFDAIDLSGYGARNFRASSRRAQPRSLASEPGMRERGSLALNQDPDDLETRMMAEERLRELAQDRAQAERTNDTFWLDEINDEVNKIRASLNVTNDNKVRKQRTFRDKNHKKAYDTVVATITNAIEDLKKQSLQIGKELERQVRLNELMFVREHAATPWEVVWMK